jgi:hypothetical protein
MSTRVVRCSYCGIRQMSSQCTHNCCATCCPSTRGYIKKNPCKKKKHRPKCPKCLTVISLERAENNVISCKSCNIKYRLVPILKEVIDVPNEIWNIRSEYNCQRIRSIAKSRTKLCAKNKESDAKDNDFLKIIEKKQKKNSADITRCEMICLSNRLNAHGDCIHCIVEKTDQLRNFIYYNQLYKHSRHYMCHRCNTNVCANHFHLHQDCEIPFEFLIELVIEQLPYEIANIVCQYK